MKTTAWIVSLLADAMLVVAAAVWAHAGDVPLTLFCVAALSPLRDRVVGFVFDRTAGRSLPCTMRHGRQHLWWPFRHGNHRCARCGVIQRPDLFLPVRKHWRTFDADLPGPATPVVWKTIGDPRPRPAHLRRAS